MSTQDDRGWVKAVEGEGDSHMDPIVPTGRTISSSVIAGVVLVAIVLAAVVGTIVWRNRQGDPYASARSVPADLDFVVTFDALALSDSERLQAFVDAFAVPMVDAEIIDDYPDDLVEAIDDALHDESGYTLTDDIFPWIGRSISFAMSVPDMDLMTAEVNEIDMLMSADVRDLAAAEAFVEKLLETMADEDIEVSAAQIGGLPGYLWLAEEGQDINFGLLLTDDTLLVGVEETLASAIEAREAGLSIAEDAVFQDTMNRLPSDAMMTAYVGPGLMDGFAELAEQELAPDAYTAFENELFESVGVAVGLVDEGVRFNYVMTGVEESQTEVAPHVEALAGLPDDTLGFFSFAGTSAGADAQYLEDLGYPFDELSDQLGIDIAELVESLTGAMTFAVTETRDSIINDSTDVPIGLVAAIGLSDPDPMSDVIDLLESFLADQGGEFDRDGDVTTVSSYGDEFFSYSLDDSLLVVGTGSRLVSDVAAGEGGDLLDSLLYQELDAAVMGDGLVGYIDVEAIVDLVPLTRDEQAVFAPVRGIGFGGQGSDDVSEMEVLILVDY